MNGNTLHWFDVSTTEQLCWECGHRAGGYKAHIYYGNYRFGIQHLDCGQRIKKILDRSLRALSAIGNDANKQTINATMNL